jgi:lipopolysaccharide transport system permease protein
MSERPGSRIDLAGVFWTLVRTDFKSRYHGTAGGFAWALLKPALMFIVLIGVFSFVFASVPNYPLNLILGLFLWDFFAEATKTGLVSLHTKGYLLSKAPLPSWILVVASTSNAVITLGVFVVALFGYLIGTGHGPTLAGSALFLAYLAAYFLIVVGFCLGGSVLFLKYRDLNQVWDVATQAGFFVAPIIYPLAVLPERVHFFLYAWPPTPVLQFSRAVLVEGSIPSFRAHLMLAGMTVAILAVGMAVFAALSRDAAENV